MARKNKEPKATLLVHVAPSLRKQVEQLAEKENRSMSNTCEQLLKLALSNTKLGDKAA